MCTTNKQQQPPKLVTISVRRVCPLSNQPTLPVLDPDLDRSGVVMSPSILIDVTIKISDNYRIYHKDGFCWQHCPPTTTTTTLDVCCSKWRRVACVAAVDSMQLIMQIGRRGKASIWIRFGPLPACLPNPADLEGVKSCADHIGGSPRGANCPVVNN